MHIYIIVVVCFMLTLVAILYRIGLCSWHANTKRADITIASLAILTLVFIIIACSIDRKFDSKNIVDKWSVLAVERKEVIMKGKDNVISTRDLPGMIITNDIEKGTVVSVKCNLGIFYTYTYFINY